MSKIENYPSIRPSLLLDFANSGRVDPRIQCVRASTATCIGRDGKLRSVAANVPRIDFDPLTGKCAGLLVEEARTNLLVNSVFAGAVSGTPGVAPTNFPFSVGNGSTEVTPAGLYTSVRLTTATPARHFLTQLNISVDVGQHVFSLPCNFNVASSIGNFLAAVAGTAAFTVRYFVDGIEIASGVSVGTGKKKLSMLLDVTTAGTLSMRFGVGVVVSTVGDVEFSLPQLEKGAFPTSPVLTTTGAVTRAADVLSLSGLVLPKAWTALAEQQVLGISAFSTLFSVDSPSIPSNVRLVATNAGNNRPEYAEGASSTNLTALNISVSAGEARRVAALATDGVSLLWALNGTASAALAQAVNVQGSPNLRIGLPVNTQFPFSGRVSRIAIYPAMLNAVQLQRLTKL